MLFPKRMGDPAELGAMVRAIAETGDLDAEVLRLDGGDRMPPQQLEPHRLAALGLIGAPALAE